MQYHTVFEVTQKGFEWWVLVILLGIPLSASIYWRDLKNTEFTTRKLFAYFGMVFFGVTGAVAFWSDFRDYEKCKTVYETGHYKVVEGLVENFRPMPYEGHQNESFAVNGVQFAYSDYAVYPGFNNAASHGGPIREGLPVRIAYVGNDILRIDIGTEISNAR